MYLKLSILSGLLLASFVSLSSAYAAPLLVLNPDHATVALDSSGNASFSITGQGITNPTNNSRCTLRFFLSTNQASLNRGRIKNTAANPKGALVMFSSLTNAGNPNTQFNVSVTGVTLKPKKDTIYGRGAMLCGKKKKDLVLSRVVSFDFAALTSATKKATPLVIKELRKKTSVLAVP